MINRSWKYGTPIRLTIVEERIDLMNMLSYAICDVDDADAIKGIINGVRSYYQQKYQTVKEEDDRMRAKMIEDYEKEVAGCSSSQ